MRAPASVAGAAAVGVLAVAAAVGASRAARVWAAVAALLGANQMLQTLVCSAALGSASWGVVAAGRAVVQALRGRLFCSITIANRDEVFDKVVDFIGKHGELSAGGLTAHTAKKEKTWKDWRQEFLMGKREADQVEYRQSSNNNVHVIHYKGARILMTRTPGETIVAGYERRPLTLESLTLSHWFACYRGDEGLVEALLRHNADPSTASAACEPGAASAACAAAGGESALHVAILRGRRSLGVCGQLLALGAAPDARLCFAVDADDEPEWNEQSQAFEGGLAGLSALQVATRRCPRVCAMLRAAGADGSAAARLPPRPAPPAACELARGDDGEPLECAICLSEVELRVCSRTPCCNHAFHGHCLRRVCTCPMCRAPMPAALWAAVG